MGHFGEWVKQKRQRMQETFDDDTFSNRPEDKFRFNNDDNTTRDYGNDLKELMHVVMSKYRPELLSFLNRLCDSQGDHEIKELLQRIDSERESPDPWRPKHHSERDDIMPPDADRGAEMMGGM